jgi:hypothetical protein
MHPDSTILGHLWSALKALYRLCGYGYAPMSNRLRSRGEELARSAYGIRDSWKPLAVALVSVADGPQVAA